MSSFILPMEIDAINATLREIWAQANPDQTAGRIPLFRSKPIENCLLFVGLNPSFSETGFKQLLANTPHHGIDIHDFYRHPESKSFDEAICMEIEDSAKDQHSYFKPLKKIAKHLEVPWDHVDLFSVRETNQNAIKRVLFTKEESLTEFGQKQLNLAEHLILKSNPIAIVVVNALGSRIFEKHLNPAFNEELGCHLLTYSGRKVPVFFTSMLSGQRALDTYSRDRLQWHIRFALGKVAAGLTEAP